MNDIEIVYSDKYVAVAVKPQGIESEHQMPALLSEKLGVSAFPVHRLDKDAGGLMVFALNKFAAAELGRAVSDGDFKKDYFAVVIGSPDEDEGVFEDYLFHDKSKNKSYTVSKLRKGVKLAKLEYSACGCVDHNNDKLTLCRIHLLTGRTHQIRVQFSSRKMPLFGDVKYGGKRGDIPLSLWSCHISFTHPKTKETLDFNLLPPECSPWDMFDMKRSMQF